MSSSKLTRRKSIDEDLKSRKFFCSELIAKIYKILGLLPEDKSACQYKPLDFSQRTKKPIVFEESRIAKLGEEKIIIF